MSCYRRVQTVLACATLVGCGLIDELSSPDAADYCDHALGGPAAYVHVTRSRNEDGAIDLAVTKFDGWHHPVASLHGQSDGTVEVASTYRWEYDEDGRIVGESFDRDADGSVDFSSVSTPDEAGNIVLDETDSDGDGVIDHVTSYTYDDDGRRLSRTHSDGDGEVRSLTIWTHDDSGGSLEQSDDNADGIIDWTTTVLVSSAGIVWTEYDSDADGEPEEIWKATYDEAGRVVEETRDQNADGEAETTYAAIYSADGELEREISSAPGFTDTITSYLRDDLGRLTSIETRTGETLNHLVSYSYEDGHTLRVSTNYETDGRVERRRWEKLGEDGRRLVEGSDEDGDGQDDWVTTIARCPEAAAEG